MLTSAQLDSASPLAVLLLGQPQLRASMRLGVLAALDQRIGVRYAMAADDPRRNRRPTCGITPSSPAAPTPCSATTPPA